MMKKKGSQNKNDMKNSKPYQPMQYKKSLMIENFPKSKELLILSLMIENFPKSKELLIMFLKKVKALIIIKKWKEEQEKIRKSQEGLSVVEKLIIFLKQEKSVQLLFIILFFKKKFDEDFSFDMGSLKRWQKRKAGPLIDKLETKIEIKKEEHALLLKKENALIFKSQLKPKKSKSKSKLPLQPMLPTLHMPIFHKLKIRDLVIWLYNVELEEDDVKMWGKSKDNNKQLFCLIYNFQKSWGANKLELFIVILSKIQQQYIKNGK